MAMKQTSGRIDSNCIESRWQSERGDNAVSAFTRLFFRGRSQCIRRLRKVSAQVRTFCGCVVKEVADLSPSQKGDRALLANVGELVRLRRS